ncbi:MAG TPA: DNA translocase FtsK 4TM domain-containing protein [Anaerolineae bacterium]|nr:DNA translocase FtsK 4TM domain-containing protein [Anaerolineae bacterium]
MTRRRSSGSSSSRSRRSSSQSRRSKPRINLSALLRIEILGIAVLALAILTFLSLISPNQGQVTSGWLGLLRQGFGWGAYLMPIVLGTVGLGMLMAGFSRLPPVQWEKVFGLMLLFVVVMGLSHLFTPVEDPWTVVTEGRGGGLVGWAVGYGLEYAIGRIGAYVALFAFAFISVVLVLGQSTSDIAMAVALWFDELRERIALWRAERAARVQASAGEKAAYELNPRGTSHGGGRRARSVAAPSPRRPLVIGEEPGPAATAVASVPGPVGEAAAARVVEEPAPALSAFGKTRSSSRPSGGKLAPWRLPDVSRVLDDLSDQEISQAEIQHRVQVIEKTLDSFGVPARVVEVNQGPVITQFGVEPGFTVGRGGKETKVKVSRISSLVDDLSLALAAAPIRIEAPVPGRPIVGIEVPNEEVALVSLRGVMESQPFKRLRRKTPLPIALGENVAGEPIVADLMAMPHLLIAGATGSGKSVCINAIISCFLCTNTPDTLQMIMVDPKRVELTGFNGIPHLLAPVVVDLERVVGTLQWVTREMEQRYRRFAKVGARNIDDFNKRVIAGEQERMPYIVVLIDELADLMMIAPDAAEKHICRIAQMARATGIHLIIATQRPSVDVVTGLIKANFPARISFMVTSGVDSRVIIDTTGAERLLGSGDMLFMSPDASQPMRLQGCFVSPAELDRLIGYWRRESAERKGEKMPGDEFIQSALPTLQEMQEPEPDPLPGAADELLPQAVELVKQEGRASTTLLQRHLRIGYARASRIIEAMEERGIVGPDQGGSQGRQVLVG